MSKTLLNGVNEVFKRLKIIAGDAAALTTLTDSARQHPIDVAVQVINEGMDELYSLSKKDLPNQQAESTITLATGTREYALHASLARLHWPLIDKTNTQYLHEFPGGYDALLLRDPEQDDTGLPHYAVISPVTGYLRMDRAPTSVENGNVYTYQYEKDVVVAAAADVFPFRDKVFRAMVPVWAELYKREQRNEFDAGFYKFCLGRASRYLSQVGPRDSYLPR